MCSEGCFPSAGLYCSGWLKTGPTGVIATTMNNSFDTARSLMEDMDSGKLDVSAEKPGSLRIRALLEEKGTTPPPLWHWFSISRDDLRYLAGAPRPGAPRPACCCVVDQPPQSYEIKKE